MRIWIAGWSCDLINEVSLTDQAEPLETVSNTRVTSFDSHENVSIDPEFMPSLVCPGKLHMVLL